MRRFTIVFLACLLVACSAPVSAIETAVGETQSAWTQVPSQTAYPTYTPQPTYTPRPTYTALPTVVVTRKVTQVVTQLVTATAPPSFVELYRFTGNGRSTSDLFLLPTGKARITWTYTGTSNFAFYLKRLDNDAEVLIENTIGDAAGQEIMNVGLSDQYLIDVEYARGPWEVIVEFRP